MRNKILISIIWCVTFIYVAAQENSSAGFHWGNGYYYNMDTGDKVIFNDVEVELLQVKNHYNKIRLGDDSLWLKVARRSLPVEVGKIRIFVADNRNVKELTRDSLVHGLLTKDALVCLSSSDVPLLEPDRYIFPVSFNDGFLWGAEEDSYLFSWLGQAERNDNNSFRDYEGIGIDLHDARGIDKHWLVAIEDCSVAGIKKSKQDRDCSEVCVWLKSESQPGIYYVYNHLYSKNLLIKEGNRIVRGEIIGTAWGDKDWGHLQFSVIKSDTLPDFGTCFQNVINGFPQFFSLYFGKELNYSRTFTKGRIVFGKPRYRNGNSKNNLSFERYTGKGWLTGKWNIADKVETVSLGDEGNVRLPKVLFKGTPAESRNPDNYYEYNINVSNGVYRIRAEVGDIHLSSWQKIEFEGIAALTASLEPGEFEWTTERIVKVEDGRLTIRVYIDKEDLKPAGLREIVFQRAY